MHRRIGVWLSKTNKQQIIWTYRTSIALDLGKTYQIKIPASLAEIAVCKREVNGKFAVKTGKGYRVATDLHYLSFFCILKAYSPNTSLVSYWTDEIEYVMSITNLSRRGIYKYLNKLKDMGLLIPCENQGDRRRKLSEFNLISWDRLAEKYELESFNKFIEIQYDKDNKDHHPKYLIIQAEILHNKDKQEYMFLKKADTYLQNYAQHNNPDFPTHKKPSRKTNTSKQHSKAEVMKLNLLWAKLFKSFDADTMCESEDELKSAFFAYVLTLNPSTDRGLAGFMRSYYFTDLHRSIYMKKQLVKRNFGEFKKQVKIYSEVGNRAPKYTILQEDGTTVKRQQKNIWNPNTKQSGIWLVDIYTPIKPQPQA